MIVSRRITPLCVRLPPFIGLVDQPLVQDLLRCANICSSLLWWLGFIPGLPRIGNQKTEGQSAFGAVNFSGAAKAKRRRHYPRLPRRSLANRRLTVAPRRTCCFAPNSCSSLPWWLGINRACPIGGQ